MLRIASVMLVLALITTCVISGTFAKYVTANTVTSDTGKVAKWTKVTAGDVTFFDNSYTLGDPAVTIASADHAIVAPGTSKSGVVPFTFTGTPEVKYDLEFSIAPGFEDIFLAAGDYADPTGELTGKATAPAGGYTPVKFTITVKAGETVKNIITGSITEISAKSATALTAHFNAGEIPTIIVSWAWAAEVDANTNALDTILGQADALQTINFTLKVKAVQVFA